jgi:hypothetical protein
VAHLSLFSPRSGKTQEREYKRENQGYERSQMSSISPFKKILVVHLPSKSFYYPWHALSQRRRRGDAERDKKKTMFSSFCGSSLNSVVAHTQQLSVNKDIKLYFIIDGNGFGFVYIIHMEVYGCKWIILGRRMSRTLEAHHKAVME